MTNTCEVAYFSAKLLATVRIHELFSVLFDAFGVDVIVSFRSMNQAERAESSSSDGGLTEVYIRVMIYEFSADSKLRRKDLEARIDR
jgi:hypothetical protein